MEPVTASLAVMVRTAGTRTTVERLVDELFDGDLGVPMAEELAGWLAASPRFHAFADAHRTKIRKKLRGAADAEARGDVRAELQAARLLLADRRIELAFEAYGSGKPGPDFSITFRDTLRFDLEVTRLRRAPDGPGHRGQLLAKIRQLPRSVPNVVLISIEGDDPEAFDVPAATRSLRARADRKDEGFFVERGFDGTRDFYERYLRLGAVVVWCEAASGDARAAPWTNGSARIPLPPRVGQACLVCFRAA